MRIAKILKSGTTTERKAFWDAVADIVASSQKVEGKNVSVDVRYGYGSVIHANPQRDNSQGIGACCIDGECSLITAAQCSDAGGNFLGIGTTCDDVDCTQGACCDGGDCTITTEEGCAGDFQGYGTVCDPNPCPPTGACCFEDYSCLEETSDQCDLDGGIYRGDGTTCDPNLCPCNGCGFYNPDDGITYRTVTYTNTPDTPSGCAPEGPCCIGFDTGDSCCPPFTGARWYFATSCPYSYLKTESYDADCNYSSTNEDVYLEGWIGAACAGEGGVAVPDCNGECDCDEPDVPPDLCPFSPTVCQTVTTTIAYSDPCIP